MKHTLPFIAVGAGLAGSIIATAASFAKVQPGSAEPSVFVRPEFEAAAAAPAPDLKHLAAFRNSLSPRAIKPKFDVGACYAALDRAGVSYAALDAMHTADGCGYDEALELKVSTVAYTAPEPLVATCELAARLYLWEEDVVRPAAMRHFGVELDAIEAFGAYSCRKVANTDKLSEHAYGKAVDVKAFKLADGREITVLTDFRAEGPAGDFLREVHDASCGVFDVTLGPDYNADHANHFHLDVGGEHACR